MKINKVNLFLFAAVLNVAAGSSIINEEESLDLEGCKLKSMQEMYSGRGPSNDIMNLESVFERYEDNGKGLKNMTGKSKGDKKKKKKKHHSSSSSDDEKTPSVTIRPSRDGGTVAPPAVRQQDAKAPAAPEYNDGSITVNGPIRRKPLIFPNSS